MISINPMYFNVAVLFISECQLHLYTGKSISVINSKFLWLEMSVCNFLDCNEDIFANIL